MITPLRLPLRPGVRLFGLQCRRCYSTTVGRNAEAGRALKQSEPLRILFCGSDKFSCESLLALHREHTENADLIQSIDVVARPGKPKGRGMKQIVYPDIHHEAAKHNLPIHSRDTFTGWSPPSYINLIIAVSFGLFVPPRILTTARYGGLNLHPSLLPDFRGAAPLQHTLLARRPFTGVTLQTLHPEHFDRGVVLSQVPSLCDQPPDVISRYLASDVGCPIPEGGIPIAPSSSSYTANDLRDLLAPVAADLLVRGLRQGLHVPPLEDRSWQPDSSTSSPLHAPKILPRMRQVIPEDIDRDNESPMIAAGASGSPSSWTSLRHLPLRSRALGPPWLYLVDQQRSKKNAEKKEKKAARVIFTEIVETSSSDAGGGGDKQEVTLPLSASPEGGSEQGQQQGDLRCRVSTSAADEDQALYFPGFKITKVKVEGKTERPAREALERFFVSE